MQKTLIPKIKNVKNRVFYEKNKKPVKTLNKKRCQINKIIQTKQKYSPVNWLSYSVHDNFES